MVVTLPTETAAWHERRKSSLSSKLDQGSAGSAPKSHEQIPEVKMAKKTVTFDSDYDDSDG